MLKYFRFVAVADIMHRLGQGMWGACATRSNKKSVSLADKTMLWRLLLTQWTIRHVSASSWVAFRATGRLLFLMIVVPFYLQILQQLQQLCLGLRSQIWRECADSGIQLQELLFESYLQSPQTFEWQMVSQLQKLIPDHLLIGMSCLEALFHLGNLFHL